MRPLALLGGTFDPIHNAHLRVAWEAAECLDAEVRLVPAPVPPHRAQPVASAEQRVALVRAALTGQERLVLDTRELRRAGPSYTVDTLAELRAEIGPQRPLVLLVGADAFAGLPSWHRWTELFSHAHIGVLTRPGHGGTLPTELRTRIASRRANHADALRTTPAGRVLAITVTPLEISATQVRSLLAAGREPRYLVPDALLAEPALLAPYRA
ncbi:MAG: nicotinate-nucleotide adenylyltransferase [Dokdonella sp.]|uniref:nicotinate-nucleotide adenylyltransferase n=1 Tax=Dokdonella sp. TaxID=2291710 RepID=UPI0025BD1F37|nr:nicotinate-nucleotide adenylyltransferase [Dokdonella sp.]MBX3701171.1 nicotinate-nucleotide adenylyltransferase [Dokdonella sp.]MCW5579704.1 nicotinate-nucleotide adenylyltransferase [Dokdonella sp.]